MVVRLHDIRNATKARKAGADEIVSPDFTGGMRIASAMVRPNVVNFLDQMLHSDGGLRLEEVVIPAGFAARPLGTLAPRAQEYLVMAVHENGNWVFNPEDQHLLQGGATLVFMANAGGRVALERRLLA